MLKRLITIVWAGVIFGSIFSSDILADTFEKLTPQKIPLDQIVPSSRTPLTGDKGFCLIQSDNGTPPAYLFGSFQAGDGFASYMDPAKCGLPDPYPFKITDVHFYLYNNPPDSTWPVQIQVNIRDLLTQGNKCDGPGNLLCFETFIIPIDSSYDSLGRLMNLTIDSLCCVYSPFFLEIIYPGEADSAYPSLLMTDATDRPDTCDVWFYFQQYYYEWLDTLLWTPPAPGYPIMRITGDTRFTAVEEEEETGITPRNFALHQSYPNPFNNQTVIKYDLVKPCQVTLTIYNILGQKVNTLVNQRQEVGPKIISWDGKDEKGKDLATGIYFYQLKAGDLTQTKRMVLLK
jgi:hypothetical protein